MALDDEIGEHVALPAGFRHRNGTPPHTNERIRGPAYATMSVVPDSVSVHNSAKTMRRWTGIVAGTLALATIGYLLLHSPHTYNANQNEPKISQYQHPTR